MSRALSLALVVTLSGLAHAGTGSFEFMNNVRTQPAFIDAPLGSGDSVSPAFGDLDGDGDQDLVVGQYDGNLRVFWNTGSATSPRLELDPDWNPFAGHSMWVVPELADIDGDGDLDLACGDRFAGVSFLENTGSAMEPVFVYRSGAANPLSELSMGNFNHFTFGDLDGDGDLDAVGGGSGSLSTWFNDGASNFTRMDVETDYFAGESVCSPTRPRLVDLDADGDLDLAIGGDGWPDYFENTGSATTPCFERRMGEGVNPLYNCTTPQASQVLAFADLFGQGHPALLTSDYTNACNMYVSNTTGGSYSEANAGSNPFRSYAGFYCSPTVGDLNGDGLADALVGQQDGHVHYLIGELDALGQRVMTQVSSVLPGDHGGYVHPRLVDLNADGLLDVVMPYGRDMRLYTNAGTASNPYYNGWESLCTTANYSDNFNAAFSDWDHDGDLDMLLGCYSGSTLECWENQGSAISPSFVYLEGVNPLVGASMAGYRNTVSFLDLNADGWDDIISGRYNGDIRCWQRDPASFIWNELMGENSPTLGMDVGRYATTTTGDITGDGVPDLISGNIGAQVMCWSFTPTLGVPQHVRLEYIGNEQVRLSWDAVPGALRYRVQKSLNPYDESSWWNYFWHSTTSRDLDLQTAQGYFRVIAEDVPLR